MPLDWKDDPHLMDRSFRIVDLAARDGSVRGRVFEDCTIYGPAVILPVDRNSFEHCIFEADLDAMLWEIPEERERVVGVVGLFDCTFRRCVFQVIGIAGPRPLIEDFRRVLSAEAPEAGQPDVTEPGDE